MRSQLNDELVVEHEPNLERGDAHYAEFYQDGGWKYSFWPEFWWLRRNVVKRFGLKRGMRVLEVACGAGFQTHVLNRMGLECIGVDRSQAAINWARSHHPRWSYHCCDVMGEMPVARSSFDCVFARGFSNYHYDLTSASALETTGRMTEYVKPGGVFVMSIASDLSGRREPDRIWHNTREDYARHFVSFGLPWSFDYYKGMVICGLWNEPSALEGAGAAKGSLQTAGMA